jgi:hypothetical protein
MDIPTQAELLAKIEDFCRRHDMAETRFGRDAVNNPAFLSGLRRDPPVSPTLDTLNKVRDFMAETDERARLREKLDAPLEPATTEDGGEQLPFGTAPVNPTGASSPTCSPTTGHRQSSAASASSHSSSDAEGAKAA